MCGICGGWGSHGWFLTGLWFWNTGPWLWPLPVLLSAGSRVQPRCNAPGTSLIEGNCGRRRFWYPGTVVRHPTRHFFTEEHLHDKVAPFHDDRLPNIGAAAFCGHVPGPDAPRHSRSAGQDLWLGLLWAGGSDTLYIQPA